MIKTINDNWLKEFKSELKNTNTVYIVSPFITDNIVKHLLDAFKGKTIKVITRYDLNDFRKGVSSLTAIERLLKNKVQIKGVMGLHSKLYLFDQKSVIITSANFTNGGFFNNKEFGVVSKDKQIISESIQYFNDLWRIDFNLLSLDELEKWRKEIKSAKPLPKKKEDLKDYGASYTKTIIGDRRYFVKFFGKDDTRASLKDNVLKEVEGGCSHFALSFSRSKRNARPRRYRDGDIVFMAYMTDTYDYAIYGKATTFSHNDKRDVASQEDINEIFWLKEFPIFIRVKDPVYINSTFEKCPKLSDLMNELSYDCFESTARRYHRGERNIKPKNSLMQKGDIRLSEAGAQWMELAFKQSVKQEGKIKEKIIKELYQGLKLE